MTSPLMQDLPPFQNVAANQTAVLPDLPQGMTYEAILLELGGTTFTQAQVSNIRVLLGGKRIWDISGANLNSMNSYYKRDSSAAYLVVWFANPNAFDDVSYYAGAIDTSRKYSSFSLEVDIGGATAPTLKGYALRSAPIDKRASFKNMMRTLVKQVHSPGSAAEFSLPISVGTRSGALIRAIHYFHTNITKLQTVKDSFYLLQNGTTAMLQKWQKENYRTPQSGHIAWDPTYMNDENDAVPTLREAGVLANFEFKATVSGADTITSYSDLLTTLDGF